MLEMPDVQDHHPHHVYLDDAWYFVTASTVAHRRYFHSDAAKEIWRDKLKSLVSEFSLKLSAWVILDNHYHLLFKNPQAKFFPRFTGRLHGSTSRKINLLD